MGRNRFSLISQTRLVAIDIHCDSAPILVKSFKISYYTSRRMPPFGSLKWTDKQKQKIYYMNMIKRVKKRKFKI